MSTPRHDTPHPHVPSAFIMHGTVVRRAKGSDEWFCPMCKCPHVCVDVKPGDEGYDPECPSSYIVATEARPCPESFEIPCKYCGCCYECAADCAGMAMIMGGMIPGVHVAGVPPVKPGDA